MKKPGQLCSVFSWKEFFKGLKALIMNGDK